MKQGTDKDAWPFVYDDSPPLPWVMGLTSSANEVEPTVNSLGVLLTGRQAHRISEGSSEVLLFRVDVLTSPEG